MMLTTLFVDMNAYFASVEQQVRPSLRGKPVGVVATMTDSTCCIAASYEAKRQGVKTGTGVREAKRMCPGLRIVVARPELYVRYHHRIVEAVESCVHVSSVHSIDEMACRLLSNECEPGRAVEIAGAIKAAIRGVGDTLGCSIGIASNRILAKVAADMQKPDGLTVIQKHELPERLYALELEDLPGVGDKMHRRLESAGVRTMRELCQCSESRLAEIWESVLGNRWYRWLRGEEVEELPTHRRSVGHSHVLPPTLRTEASAKAVLIHLIHKAGVRLRRLGYWAGMLEVSVEFYEGGWRAKGSLGHCQDTQTMVEVFHRLWEQRKPGMPYIVSMVLYKLAPNAAMTMPLFPEDQLRLRVSQVMDEINSRYGTNTIFSGEIQTVRDSAPTRIAFTQIPDFSQE
jgi:DNA polymerase IV